MSETNASDASRNIATEFMKEWVVNLFQAGLCGGTMARSYLADLGIPGERIFVGYDAVDNDQFARGAERVRGTEAFPGQSDPAWRGRCFLACARFLPKKNLPRLVEAFALYRRSAGTDAWPLVLLGEGPMRGDLERQRTRLGLEGSFDMPGFKQYDDLPLYYGNAGAFVHASTTEQWGLVVNEAMASGLPVLVSERCGCAPDLVEEGRNGYTFDPDDTDALARLMLHVTSDACDRAAMGRASSAIIARWSPQRFADGLRLAVQAALDAPLPRIGLLRGTFLWALSHRSAWA
jgi:glycosyltransferase involved in cell wall biosynthesis